MDERAGARPAGLACGAGLAQCAAARARRAGAHFAVLRRHHPMGFPHRTRARRGGRAAVCAARPQDPGDALAPGCPCAVLPRFFHHRGQLSVLAIAGYRPGHGVGHLGHAGRAGQRQSARWSAAAAAVAAHRAQDDGAGRARDGRAVHGVSAPERAAVGLAAKRRAGHHRAIGEHVTGADRRVGARRLGRIPRGVPRPAPARP